MSDPSPSSDSNAKSSSPANRVRVWGSWIVILVSFIVITRALPISPAVDALKDWVESAGIWGPIAFTAVYVVASVLLIPASLLTLAAGTVFGLGIGAGDGLGGVDHRGGGGLSDLPLSGPEQGRSKDEGQ